MLTVAEVLAFAASARRAKGQAHQEIIAATGLEPVVDLKVGQLSGGWVRRLGLATALVPPSELLLLDEPFAGLDPETLDRLVEYLQSRVRVGAVVVLASHDLEVIDLLQPHLAVLDEGKLAALADGGGAGSRLIYRQTLAGGNSIPWPPLALGWLAWLLVPSFFALRQFLRVSLL